LKSEGCASQTPCSGFVSFNVNSAGFQSEGQQGEEKEVAMRLEKKFSI
jgi:hypothetical protein